MILRASFVLALLGLGGCRDGSTLGDRATGASEAPEAPRPPLAARPAQSAPSTAAPSVDSALARFQAALPTHPAVLEGGAADPDALVRGFVEALAKSDTAGLLAMAVTRAEYAYLIYPESPLVRAPYRQEIDVAWMLHAASHAKGITRLLRRLGGEQLAYESHRCAKGPATEGRNRYWSECVVRIDRPSGAIEGRLFSAIVQRDGRWNIMSYSNDF